MTRPAASAVASSTSLMSRQSRRKAICSPSRTGPASWGEAVVDLSEVDRADRGARSGAVEQPVQCGLGRLVAGAGIEDGPGVERHGPDRGRLQLGYGGFSGGAGSDSGFVGAVFGFKLSQLLGPGGPRSCRGSAPGRLGSRARPRRVGPLRDRRRCRSWTPAYAFLHHPVMAQRAPAMSAATAVVGPAALRSRCRRGERGMVASSPRRRRNRRPAADAQPHADAQPPEDDMAFIPSASSSPSGLDAVTDKQAAKPLWPGSKRLAAITAEPVRCSTRHAESATTRSPILRP